MTLFRRLFLLLIGFVVCYAVPTSSFGQGSIYGPPVIVAPRPLQSLIVTQNSSITFEIQAYDPAGLPLVYTLFSSPGFGELSGDLPVITYKPHSNYVGFDGFSYVVSNGYKSTIGRINLNVIPANNPPISSFQLPNTVFVFADYPEPVIISKPWKADADVLLDGTISGDPDGDALTFYWMEDSTQFATTALVTNTFSVGVHQVELVVSDGILSDSASAVFRVITPYEAISAIQRVLESSGVPQNKKQPVLRGLTNAKRALLNRNFHACRAELEHVEVFVHQQISPVNPELAGLINSLIDEVLDALETTRSDCRKR